MSELEKAIRRLMRKHFDFEIVDIAYATALLGSRNYEPGLFLPSISKDFDSEMTRKIFRQWERKEPVVKYPQIIIDKADPQLARRAALSETELPYNHVGPKVYTELADACHGLKRDSFVLVGIHDRNSGVVHTATNGDTYFIASKFLCAVNLRIR